MHLYPLVRSGGMFVICIGLGIIVGGLLGEQHLVIPLILGALLAIASNALLAERVREGFGTPTRFQVRALVSAIVLESVALGLLGVILHNPPLRVFLLWILIIVAFHFFIIALAQGPYLLLLGGLCILNAVTGFFLPQIPLTVFWLIDGGIKVVIGIAMFRTKPLKQVSS